MPGLKCSVLATPTLISRAWPPLVTTVASPAPVGGGATVVVVVSGAVVVVDSPVVVLDVDDDELLLVDDGSLLVVPAFEWAAPRNTVPAMSALVHSAPARNLFVIAMPPMLCWWTCELGDIPPSVSPRPRTLRNVTPRPAAWEDSAMLAGLAPGSPAGPGQGTGQMIVAPQTPTALTWLVSQDTSHICESRTVDGKTGTRRANSSADRPARS